jgi:hypothetical protein
MRGAVGFRGHGVLNREQPRDEVLDPLTINGGLVMNVHGGTVLTGCNRHKWQAVWARVSPTQLVSVCSARGTLRIRRLRFRIHP